MSQVLHDFYVTMTEPRPPSVNHLYRNGFMGKRVLSKEGVAFKSAMRSLVAEACTLLPWKEALDAVYNERASVCVVVVLHGELLNATWKPGRLKTVTKKQIARAKEQGKPAPKPERQSPYKKWDGPSYLKVIEDAVVEGTGIDDSVHMDVRVIKRPGPHRVEVAYEIVSWE